MTNPFADSVVAYAQAGWPCIIPVPPVEKHPPPTGYTGADGRDTDPLQLVTWAGTHASHAVALRMPAFGAADGSWTVIGIDVDSYEKAGKLKRGAETLAVFEQRWGPLPPTWTSTARGPGPSRIHFYRVPARRYVTKLDTGTTSDVEIIQRHHRYAVVWPSPHKDAGTYTWYDPTGQPADRPPRPHELPWLSEAWVVGLGEGATEAGPAAADPLSGRLLLDQLEADARIECADITSARLTAVDELRRADAGSRHDTMTARIHHLVMLAAHGHTGVAAAISELRDIWEELTGAEGRGEEFERMLLTSARKAVTVVGPRQVSSDPCYMTAAGFPLPTPAPGDPSQRDPDEPDLQIYEPPRWHGFREAIGAQAFDPNAGLDQPLAEAVLARMYPALRYAFDAGGWLLKAPDRWELHKRLSPWSVAQVAPLMPVGDPTAEKGSDQHERSRRRARFMTAAGASAIAKLMDALVTGGMHPASVALAGLDADPEILWAGGMPYSLRASTEGPAFALVDPATPHLHTAGVTPALVPTPRWDAFLEAVWPDPELRAWAVRVLSVSLTGYADRALPVLLGETGRGKTQVVHLLMSVLGSYAHAANPKLLSTGSNEHDTIVFALKGRRLSFIDEAPSDRKAGQERLKQLTGGGELTARQMNQDPITFRPTHTLVLTANDEPVLTDHAVRARVRLIPCEGDPELVSSTRTAIGHVSSPVWRAEAPGVLAKMMTEAAHWLADPSSAMQSAAPEWIRYSAELIAAEQDPITRWIEDETEPFEQGTPSRELYAAFVASCRQANIGRDVIPSETKWGRELTRRGYPSQHTRVGKARLLRIRHSGGWLPEAGPARDGLGASGDGFVTGSNPNPSQPFAQVNPSVSVERDGCDGLNNPPSHMRAPEHAHEAGPENAQNPSHPSQPPAEPPGEPAPAKRPRKPADPARTEAARVARVTASQERRLAAIAEAAGAQVALPALVTRDGAVTSVGLGQLEQLLATLAGQALTVDVETTGYPVGHRNFVLRTVQLGGEHFAVVLDPAEPDQADVIRRYLAAAPMLHAHSATADLVPLAAAGLVDAEDAWSRMVDTVVLAKLDDPASTGSDPGLKQLSAAMLGDAGVAKRADEARSALFKAGKWLTDLKVHTPLERSGWAQVDPTCETMVRYAASDVLDDAAIATRLAWPTEEILTRERTAQRMVSRIAHDGLRIDGEHVEQLRAEWGPKLEEAGARLREHGVENPGSDQQVGTVAVQLGAELPRTKTGRPSVAKGNLAAYTELEGPLGDFARARLDYQKAENALGLFLEPYHQLVVHGDGRARPTVYTLSADTGRTSCVRPNLQQVPREGGFRACITADPGYLLISADFASVELRVAAALSQDPDLMRIVANPDKSQDLHWQIARMVWGPNATKAHRYKAKPMVFGRLYGSGAPGMARQNGVSEPVARQVIDALDLLTPGLSSWSRRVADGIETGRTRFPTYAGRVVHMPVDRAYAGPNYCIQGTARELLVDALMRWARTRWGTAVVLPVHDELMVHVPEDEADEATAALVEAMSTELYGVEIKVEASTPTFAWSDAA